MLSSEGVEMPDKVRAKAALEALRCPVFLLPRSTQVGWNKQCLRQEQLLGMVVIGHGVCVHSQLFTLHCLRKLVLSKLSECPQVQAEARVKEGSPAALCGYKPCFLPCRESSSPWLRSPFVRGAPEEGQRPKLRNYFNESSKPGNSISAFPINGVCQLLEDQIGLAQCGLLLCRFELHNSAPSSDLQGQGGVATGPAGVTGVMDRAQGVRAAFQPHFPAWSSDPSRLNTSLPILSPVHDPRVRTGMEKGSAAFCGDPLLLILVRQSPIPSQQSWNY